LPQCHEGSFDIGVQSTYPNGVDYHQETSRLIEQSFNCPGVGSIPTRIRTAAHRVLSASAARPEPLQPMLIVLDKGFTRTHHLDGAHEDALSATTLGAPSRTDCIRADLPHAAVMAVDCELVFDTGFSSACPSGAAGRRYRKATRRSDGAPMAELPPRDLKGVRCRTGASRAVREWRGSLAVAGA